MTAECALAISRRLRLRDGTRTLHESVDARISRSGFLTTREGYNAYLRATLQARAAVEADLDHSLAHTVYPEWAARRIADELLADLADLAGAPAGAERPAMSPVRLDVGEIWGTLYVLEGSSVGARILLRRAEDLRLSPSFGARHLARQTARPAAWKAFVTLLDEVSLTQAEENRCMDAAIMTFQRFYRAYAELTDC